MKIHTQKKTLLTGLFMVLFALYFTACHNEDDNSGLPVIHRVRTTDPELKDSTFVKGKPGQMLVVEGENFSSVRKVYINGQEIDFNSNYVTPKTIILTVPDELVLTGIYPELPKEIWIENKKGFASYAFHILSPAPSISRLEVVYPVNPGDRVLIHGENFYEIESIILEGQDDEGEPTGVNVEINQFVIPSTNYDIILFALPQGAAEKGEVVLTCAAGEARYPYATVVQQPVILSFSSDMPVIGAEFFITGTYFIDVEKVNINGEYDILIDDLRVVQSADTIYMKLPAEPAAPGIITVTAAGGVSDDDKVFYPKENVIANFDDVGSLSWAGSLFTGGGDPPYITTGNAAGDIHINIGAPEWWFGNVLANIEYTDAIAGSTPVSDLVVRFECFIAYPLKTITFNVSFGGGSEISAYVPKSFTSGKTEIGKWMTCQIPLSMLAEDATSYSDVKAFNPEFGFYAKNGADGETVERFGVYYDNIRIVNK